MFRTGGVFATMALKLLESETEGRPTEGRPTEGRPTEGRPEGPLFFHRGGLPWGGLPPLLFSSLKNCSIRLFVRCGRMVIFP